MRVGVGVAYKEVGAERGPVAGPIHLPGQGDFLAARGSPASEMTHLV